MDEQSVCVIITTRDRAEMLERVLPSYLQPSVSQVIVVDDGSVDFDCQTRERWESFDPRVRVLHHESPLGQPASRNKGLVEASASFVFMSEDDVELPVGYLEYLLEVMDRHNAVVVGTGMRFLPYKMKDDENRWGGTSSPLPTLSMGPEAARELEPGVFAVSHLHGVFLMCRVGRENTRFSTEYKGSAFREESDFQVRIAGRGGLLVGATTHFFIHYRRPAHLLRTGNSRMGLVRYEYWAIRNNWMFLKRNAATLRERGVLRGGIVLAQARFASARITGFIRARVRDILPRTRETG